LKYKAKLRARNKVEAKVVQQPPRIQIQKRNKTIRNHSSSQ